MPILTILLLFTLGVSTRFHIHDANFQPDYVLVAAAKNISYNCHSRYSVLLNDTSPGPPLYLKEGQTTWVRAYNNVADQNLTVVSRTSLEV